MSDMPFLVVKANRNWGDDHPPEVVRFKNKKFTSYVCHWHGNKFVDCEGRNCKVCLSPDKPMVRYRAQVTHYQQDGRYVEKTFDIPAHFYPDILSYANSMKADEWRRVWWDVWREGTGIHVRYNMRPHVEEDE